MTPVSFTADAEVISIDAFVREPNGVIFGVTLVKVREKQRPTLEKCCLSLLAHRKAQTPRKFISICMAFTALLQLRFTGTRWLVSTYLHTDLCG